ncbi:MAG: hypothetical protein ACRDPY_21220 [Streptosporangiaceae bacterium]
MDQDHHNPDLSTSPKSSRRSATTPSYSPRPASATSPALPRQPDMAPVNVRLMGDPADLPHATAAIIAAAAEQGWKASEPSRPYPNHGGPGARVFFTLTQEDPA